MVLLRRTEYGTKVGEISKKVQEGRLKWYVHITKRGIIWERRKGGPKYSIKHDSADKGLLGEEAQDRAA